jgi:hypothetical protein
MIPFQIQLGTGLASFVGVEAFMDSTQTYGESWERLLHRLDIVAGIDCRLGSGLPRLMRGVPAFHHLIPFAIVSFGLSVAGGCLFWMTDPDQ